MAIFRRSTTVEFDTACFRTRLQVVIKLSPTWTFALSLFILFVNIDGSNKCICLFFTWWSSSFETFLLVLKYWSWSLLHLKYPCSLGNHFSLISACGLVFDLLFYFWFLLMFVTISCGKLSFAVRYNKFCGCSPAGEKSSLKSWYFRATFSK